MKKIALTCVALSVVLATAAQAQPRRTEEQLIKYATQQRACGDRVVVSAKYVSDTDNRIEVTCGDDATGFVPLVGLGLGGAGAAAAALGVGVLALAAGGGGGSTSDTQ